MPEPYIDPPDQIEGTECPDCEGEGCQTCKGQGEIFPDPFDEHCDEE